MYGLGQTLDLFLWILEAYAVRLNTSEFGRFLSFSTEIVSSFKICVDFLIAQIIINSGYILHGEYFLSEWDWV